MKAFRKLPVLVAIFIIGAAATVFAASSLLFSAGSTVKEPIGVVTLIGSDYSQTQINIPGPGFYQTNIPANIIGLMVNGKGVQYPYTGLVTLATGTQVKVSWPAQNGVSFDPNEQF